MPTATLDRLVRNKGKIAAPATAKEKRQQTAFLLARLRRGLKKDVIKQFNGLTRDDVHAMLMQGRVRKSR